MPDSFGRNIPGQAAVGAGPKPTKDDVSLAVNGKRFEGWQSLSVKRSIKAIAGAFQLNLIDKWAHEQSPWLVVPGDPCTLSIGTEKLITGYIDTVNPSFDAQSHTVSISGRDKTGDMVDCSAVHKPGNWRNITLLRLANILGEPFGISASSNVTGLPTLQTWSIQNAESAFECLERAARAQGVLLMNDGTGNILITRAGTSRAATNISQGENILSASANYDHKGRFSRYIVKAQGASLGDELPELSYSAQATATDEGVTRNRPLVIVAEGAATQVVCKQRAQWEATVRAARSSPLTIAVAGWRQASGDLWSLNQMVKVKSSWLGINQEFLISSVEFKKDSQGTTTVLELERPDAYTPDPTVSTRKEPWKQLVLEERARR